MELSRLIYVSKASPSFSSGDIDKLLHTARTNNKKLGLSGVLCFDYRYFLQYLEGSHNRLKQVFENITNDTRHHGINLLEYNPTSKLLFKNWSMGYLFDSDMLKEINDKFFHSPGFNPYMLNKQDAIEYIKQVDSNSVKL